MNDFLHNPYERLLYYDFFLCSYTGVSIQQLHEKLDIPLPVIRNDVFLVQKTMHSIFIDDESILTIENMECRNQLKEIWNSDWVSLKKIMLQGKLDTLVLYKAETCTLLDSYHIPIDADEYEALAFLRRENTLSTQQPVHAIHYLTKNSYLYSVGNPNLVEYINLTKEVIEKDSFLQIRYTNANGISSTKIFKPIILMYDSLENQYAIITKLNEKYNVYRLDRIFSLQEYIKIPDSFQKTPFNVVTEREKIIKLAPTVWKFCFTEPPVKVKIKFYNDLNGHVWRKVEKELSNRTNGKLYEKDGFKYYEDEVRGLSPFRTWVYSYGNSAVILEPQSLREQAINSYTERLRRLNE